ncbi:Uncharacterised protein [Mycobacterium tuberculosis]|nr:Uncharacterised protein [Mycobacterium tuberculosis]
MRLGGDIRDRAHLQAGGRSDRIAVSRPEPGPLTNTSTLRTPWSWALRAAFSAASWAANGVDFREPLKPTCPDDAQAMTLPCGSVMVTIVLLNVLLMWAAPCGTFFFSRRRVFWPFLADVAGPFFAGGIGYLAFFLPAMVRLGPLRVRALVFVRWPRTGIPRRCRNP